MDPDTQGPPHTFSGPTTRLKSKLKKSDQYPLESSMDPPSSEEEPPKKKKKIHFEDDLLDDLPSSRRNTGQSNPIFSETKRMKERERRHSISVSIDELRGLIPLRDPSKKEFLNQVSTMETTVEYIKYLQEEILFLHKTYGPFTGPTSIPSIKFRPFTEVTLEPDKRTVIHFHEEPQTSSSSQERISINQTLSLSSVTQINPNSSRDLSNAPQLPTVSQILNQSNPGSGLPSPRPTPIPSLAPSLASSPFGPHTPPSERIPPAAALPLPEGLQDDEPVTQKPELARRRSAEFWLNIENNSFDTHPRFQFKPMGTPKNSTQSNPPYWKKD